MQIPLSLKVFFTLIALSLIGFFFIPDADIILLVKLIALSIGLSILFALFYPTVRGIRKGDKVMISKGNLPAFLGFGRVGISMSDGRINEEIKIKLSGGREAIGTVENYGGAFNLPKVRLLYEETIKR